MGESLQPGDPRQLGGYYLDGRLGAGGQGVVYEGYDAHGRRVAVKVLRAVDEEDRARLRREIHAWRKVEPYCTTRVLEADLDGAVPYVVSEYVAGPDLRRAVNPGRPYGPEELRRLAVGLATALVAIHRAGVVHRDLKPENILLGPDGPRVIDFGIARILEGTATTGLPMGTLRYMPPERYRGEPGDGKVDVWGWAAVVLFAATGYDAFQGESLGAIADRVATYDPDTSCLEQPLRSLVTAALAKDARQRPSAEQLLLSLVGRADLAAAVLGTAPEGPPRDAPPSRAQVAEAAFAALGEQEQQAVPSILLRLVAPGERAEDTLRSARRGELGNGLVPEQVTDQVLEALTRAGVLVWEDGSATLATAALIRAWPRLRDWVAAERAGLAVHQRLAEASRTWSDHGRKRNDLLQGTPLTQAQGWAATGRFHLVLNEVERAFLDACAALTRRRGRLRVALSAVLALLLVVATGAAVVAFQQRNTLAEQRDRATSAQVAGTALSLRTSDPQLARRLAVAAAKLSDTPESWSALMAVNNQGEQDVFRLPSFHATTMDLDGSGRLLVAAEGTRVDVWDLNTRTRTASWTAPAPVYQVAVSGDGSTAAVAGDDDIVHMLDLSHGAPAPTGENFSAPHEHDGTYSQVALSPHGTYLVISIASDGPKPGDPAQNTLTVWNAHTADKIGSVSAPLTLFLLAGTSFSPDEKVLSLPVPRDGRPFLWDSLPDKAPITVPDLGVEEKDITGPVVFSPDGEKAAVATKKGEVGLFNRSYGGTTMLKGVDYVTVADYPLSFSHDGNFLTWGGTMWLTCARLATGCQSQSEPVLRNPSTEGECSPRTAAYRFTADDAALECIGTDDSVRQLNVQAYTRRPKSAGQMYQHSATSRDRTTLALQDGLHIDIWSLASRTKKFTLGAEICSVGGFRLSADGHLLATQCDDRVSVWNLAADGQPLIGSMPLQLSQRTSVALAFSPDGSTLAVAETRRDGTGNLSFWNPATHETIHAFQHQGGFPPNGLRLLFHPDGKSVYVGPGIGSVSFPSGQILAKGSDDFEPDIVSEDGTTLYANPQGYLPYLRSWDSRTLQQKDGLRTGAGAPLITDPVTDGAVSADGHLFAVIQRTDGTYPVQVWNLANRQALGVPLRGPVQELVAVAFSPDGTSLTTVDREGAFFTYPIAPALLVRDLCGRAGALTEEEWKRYIPDVAYRSTC
ncbi:protein kinase [Kitasatospora sp. NPDC051170]|uniref:protein kinase domain-containing protein n=1 Tax=Kitasatospora sp. NPDC051170 TaxID=3364056 RepID=UPI003795AB93